MPENWTPARNNKWRELLDEFRLVLGKGNLLDTIIPPVIFLLVNGMFGFQAAMWASLGPATLIAALRLWRGQSLLYALAGIGSVGLAILIVWLLGRTEGYFLPNLVSGGMTFALALISLLIRRPFVAWTSFLARRWPLEWYWHPHVRPAYSEVTIAWTIFFAARLLWQVSLFQAQAANQLAFVNVLLGWPALIILLVLSYLYGTWRLGNLKGPSVEEFRAQASPPWEGQKRGF
ncbi:MAG: DUF3159 domain-containing protein [Anaerolineales bacterium]|nr:DUF3159 domain-containing protein [Anaerolineales bacterium]